jgi:carbonic anhydrase/acetyltransferase-like protein (isoleucine patch superfamily)
VLIGMGAIIMDGAVIHSNSIIGAGTLITEGTVVESGTVWAGIPGKKIKEIDPSLLEGQVNRISRNYSMYASWYNEQ